MWWLTLRPPNSATTGHLVPRAAETATPGCTYTVYTEPVISTGPTSTSYTLTTYTSQQYNCHGCSNIAVILLGHVFLVCLSTTLPLTGFNLYQTHFDHGEAC